MKIWTKILPFFIIEWYAKKYLSLHELKTDGLIFVRPYKDILMLIEDNYD